MNAHRDRAPTLSGSQVKILRSVRRQAWAVVNVPGKKNGVGKKKEKRKEKQRMEECNLQKGPPPNLPSLCVLKCILAEASGSAPSCCALSPRFHHATALTVC